MGKITFSYREVSSKLRERILSGEAKPGEKLPSERELSEQFGISRLTLRRSLEILEHELLIHRVQGSGTFISPNPTRRIPIMIDYSGSMRKHAPKVSRTLLSWKWQKSGWASEMLEIEPDEMVLYAERLDTLQGAPVSWEQACIVGAFAHQLSERELARIDFLEAWTRKCNFTIESCKQYVEAVRANAAIGGRLKLKVGRPVLRSTEIFLTHHNRPAGVFAAYYPPDQICIFSQYVWKS